MSSSLSLNRSNSILTLSQSKRLFALLDNPIVISSIKSSSCLTVIPYLFLIRLKQQARINGLYLNEIRLTGGAASFVLDPTGDLAYRDLDFFISIDDITSESTWTKIKQTVFTSLTSIEEKSSEFYTEKIIRIINDQDRWALISLRNHDGRNLELKFVEQMKRQYQFSVDSFQIILDPLFLSSSRFPQLIVQSTYGNFHEALDHLHHRLIAVKAPEELRGGGLLKYCDLIARGFRPSDQFQMKDLQRYMCSRFFIDFRHCSTQEQILFKYVTSHFGDDYHVRWRFLQCLYEVIANDTMGFGAFERFSFLRIISMMCSTMIPMKTTPHPYSTNERTDNDRSIFLKTLIPSVPTSTTLMKKSSSSSLPAIEQIDLFVEIVHSLRTELFPKLNQLLSSM